MTATSCAPSIAGLTHFSSPLPLIQTGLSSGRRPPADAQAFLIAGSCAAEGIEEGVTGYLSEENASAYAKALERMLSDPEKMRQVGENASKEIYLSWEDAVRMAYARYESLCRNWKYPEGYHDEGWGKEEDTEQ